MYIDIIIYKYYNIQQEWFLKINIMIYVNFKLFDVYNNLGLCALDMLTVCPQM